MMYNLWSVIIIQVLVVMQSSTMATEIPAFNEDVMCGLNYALCLETTPRQRLTIHPDDQELQCQRCVFYEKCLKTTLHVVVEQLVNRPRLYRWYLHALHQWRHYFQVLCRFIRNRSRSRVATWFGCVPSTELQSGRRHSWRRRWRYSIWFVQTRLSVNCVTPPTIFPL